MTFQRCTEWVVVFILWAEEILFLFTKELEILLYKEIRIRIRVQNHVRSYWSKCGHISVILPLQPAFITAS